MILFLQAINLVRFRRQILTLLCGSANLRFVYKASAMLVWECPTLRTGTPKFFFRVSTSPKFNNLFTHYQSPSIY